MLFVLCILIVHFILYQKWQTKPSQYVQLYAHRAQDSLHSTSLWPRMTFCAERINDDVQQPTQNVLLSDNAVTSTIYTECAILKTIFLKGRKLYNSRHGEKQFVTKSSREQRRMLYGGYDSVAVLFYIYDGSLVILRKMMLTAPKRGSFSYVKVA